MSEQEKQKITKKPRPPLEGLSVAAVFWLWGVIFFYAPVYLGIIGGWRIVLNVLGGLAITVSLGGALVELGKLWKSEALAYWSVSMIFFGPAIILRLAVMFGSLSSILEKAAKIAVLILVFIGTPFLLLGLPYLFWKPVEQWGEETPKISLQEEAKQKVTKRRVNLSLIITLLNLATAIIVLVSVFAK